MKNMILILAFAFPVLAFCQETVTTTTLAAVSTTLVPAAQVVSGAVSKIPASLPAWIVAVVAFLVEMCMRFWPTAKPRSLFILVGQVFGLVGDGFKKISSLLDVIVQNLKEEPGPKV